MDIAIDKRWLLGQRALRLAVGTALCLAASFGLGLPIPMVSPVFAVFLLAMFNQPLSIKEGFGLVLVVALTTSTGLLLTPLLRYYALVGVLLIGLCLFLAFRYSMRGGHSLVTTFLVVGLTMISAAGTVEIKLAVTVVEALLKGLLLAVLVLALSHVLLPDPAGAPKVPPSEVLSKEDATRLALRATLVVLPAFLFALTDPTTNMPVIMKAVSLGRQTCTTTTRSAGMELLGSTLLAGAMAILFWFALKCFVHLWMFFLWTLLFALLVARKIYSISPTRYTPSFWINSLVTMIILLGQSVQDSLAGKDVYTAFAVRMTLFIAVTLYAYLMVLLLNTSRRLR